MPIVIIVEDGSNVAGANSYVSVADARTYAGNRGVDLSATDDDVAKLIFNGMDYIETKGCDYQGYPTNDDQELSWPRTGVSINCKDFPEDQIPKQLIGALVQLVMAQHEGVEIFPNTSLTDLVTEETVGPITTKYADVTRMGLTSVAPTLTAVDALLGPLIRSCGQVTGLMTVRV